MKNIRYSVIAFMLVLAAVATSSARDSSPEAAEALKKTFPNYEFLEVNPTPVPGIYEVVSERNIVYFAPETGHLIFGEIWSRDGKNLTAGSREERISRLVEKLPLDKAVKIGNGRNTVIEFIDPDCHFCRKGAEYLDKRTDVTRYIFLHPLADLHPGSTAKARYILSAAAPAKVYEQIMAGAYDDRPLPPFEDSGLLEEHQRLAAMLMVSGTPKYWINGTPVSGADLQKIETLLEASRENKTTSTK